MIPVVLLINAIKLCLGELLPLVAVISCTALAVELAAARIFKIRKNPGSFHDITFI